MLFCLIKITWKPLSVLSSLSGYRGVPTQRVFFFPVCPSVSHFALTRAGGSIHMEGFFRSHHLFPLLTMGVIYFLPLGILYPIWHGVSNLAFAGGGGFHACMEASFPSHNIFPFSSSLSLGVSNPWKAFVQMALSHLIRPRRLPYLWKPHHIFPLFLSMIMEVFQSVEGFFPLVTPF